MANEAEIALKPALKGTTGALHFCVAQIQKVADIQSLTTSTSPSTAGMQEVEQCREKLPRIEAPQSF